MERMSWDRAARRCSETLEFFSLASTPTDEPCIQAGESAAQNIMECRALKNQLERLHGPAPTDAEFVLIRNDHEFGTYWELGIFFKPENEETDEPSPSQEYANACERLPDLWDKAAIEELQEAGYERFKPAKVIPIRKTA